MKLLSFIIVFGLFSISVTNAQLKVSVLGGIDTNSRTFNPAWRSYMEYESSAGSYANVSLEYPLFKIFSISGGFSYVEKNNKFKRLHETFDTRQSNYSKYLDMPILLKSKLISTELFGKDHHLNLAIGAGFYGGYWLSLVRKGRYSDISSDDRTQYIRETYDFSKNENGFHRWDYGYLFMSELSYNLTKKISILFNFRYMHGLSQLYLPQLRKISPAYNTTKIFSLGVSYTFDLKRKTNKKSI